VTRHLTVLVALVTAKGSEHRHHRRRSSSSEYENRGISSPPTLRTVRGYGMMIVSAPGQNASASPWASSGPLDVEELNLFHRSTNTGMGTKVDGVSRRNNAATARVTHFGRQSVDRVRGTATIPPASSAAIAASTLSSLGISVSQSGIAIAEHVVEVLDVGEHRVVGRLEYWRSMHISMFTYQQPFGASHAQDGRYHFEIKKSFGADVSSETNAQAARSRAPGRRREFGGADVGRIGDDQVHATRSDSQGFEPRRVHRRHAFQTVLAAFARVTSSASREESTATNVRGRRVGEVRRAARANGARAASEVDDERFFETALA